jgi:hypothetical protein
MKSKATILVSGMIAADPWQGGAPWAVMQYVLGLRRLECEVFLVIEALEKAFALHFGVWRPIQNLHRRCSAYSSSCSVENIDVAIDDRRLRIVLKDLSPAAGSWEPAGCARALSTGPNVKSTLTRNCSWNQDWEKQSSSANYIGVCACWAGHLTGHRQSSTRGTGCAKRSAWLKN